MLVEPQEELGSPGGTPCTGQAIESPEILETLEIPGTLEEIEMSPEIGESS